MLKEIVTHSQGGGKFSYTTKSVAWKHERPHARQIAAAAVASYNDDNDTYNSDNEFTV